MAKTTPTETNDEENQKPETETPQPITYKRLIKKNGQPQTWPHTHQGSDGIKRYIPWL